MREKGNFHESQSKIRGNDVAETKLRQRAYPVSGVTSVRSFYQLFLASLARDHQRT